MPTGNTDKWTEWSMKVLEELTSLNRNYDNLEKEIETLRKTIEDKDKIITVKIEQINNLLNGNGTPERGIIVRLDRLEQSEQRRTWLLRTTIVASVAAIISSVVNYIKNIN